MKNWFLIFLLILVFSCAVKSERRHYYISTLENIKKILPTEKEAKIMDSLNKKSKEFYEKCEREKLNCFIDGSEIWAEFKGGTNKFRELLFNNFKLSKTAKKGENRIRVTIGRNNNLEKIEILQYTDDNTRAAIEDVFKLKELDIGL